MKCHKIQVKKILAPFIFFVTLQTKSQELSDRRIRMRGKYKNAIAHRKTLQRRHKKHALQGQSIAKRRTQFPT